MFTAVITTIAPVSGRIGTQVTVSGSGFDVQGAYAQNLKKLPEYESAIHAGRLPIERGRALDPDDRLRRHVITQLMCNLHLDVRYGENAHHIVEALFKAFARAASVASRRDPRVVGVPSTKGTLTS